MNSETESKINQLDTNLKSVNQKIDNIVAVIANTGSQALISSLESLEHEKQQLLLQIKAEQQSVNVKKLSDKDIMKPIKTKY